MSDVSIDLLELFQRCIQEKTVARVTRLRTSRDERIHPFQRFYSVEMLVKTNVNHLKKALRKTDICWNCQTVPTRTLIHLKSGTIPKAHQEEP